VLRHYWNAVVELLPTTLAPNMVTLLGFVAILVNVIVLTIFVPDMDGKDPSWVYYSFAAGLWFYSTMDNIDGKQARRTKTSSPLGELFDHGIDSLNCTLASLLETAALGLGTSKTGAFMALLPCLPMFFSTWETYHTHTLYLGHFNGPTEGLLIACIMMIISGASGPAVWATPFVDIWPSLKNHVAADASLKSIWGPLLLVAFLVAHLPACVVHVAKARRAQNLPVFPTILEWTPMLAFTIGCTAWLGSPYSSLLKDNHLVLFCLTMSLVFGRMTTKVILAHLTRQPFPFWTVMLIPLGIGSVLVNLPFLGFAATSDDAAAPFLSASAELNFLRFYFVFALVVYSNWAYVVITSICNYLGINCLTIKSPVLPSTADGTSSPRAPLLGNGVGGNKRVD